jgi:hypothetical protein
LKSTDLLRRSTPTPLSADLGVMGQGVRLETNSAAALERMRNALAGFGGDQSAGSKFLWRLIVEPDTGCEAIWPAMAALSDQELYLVNIGQYSFIAVDLKVREAVIFLEERFMNDELTFENEFLATLVKLTAPALRRKTHLP